MRLGPNIDCLDVSSIAITESPTGNPTQLPTFEPSTRPSSQPSAQPTSEPSSQPTDNVSISRSLSRPLFVMLLTDPYSQSFNFLSPLQNPQSHLLANRQVHRRLSLQMNRQLLYVYIFAQIILLLCKLLLTWYDCISFLLFQTMQPTDELTSSPTLRQDEAAPSSAPTSSPSSQPTAIPSQEPSSSPNNPTNQPTSTPSKAPSQSPINPTSQPSVSPSSQPTPVPTSSVSSFDSISCLM